MSARGSQRCNQHINAGTHDRVARMPLKRGGGTKSVEKGWNKHARGLGTLSIAPCCKQKEKCLPRKELQAAPSLPQQVMAGPGLHACTTWAPLIMGTAPIAQSPAGTLNPKPPRVTVTRDVSSRRALLSEGPLSVGLRNTGTGIFQRNRNSNGGEGLPVPSPAWAFNMLEVRHQSHGWKFRVQKGLEG